MSEITGTTTISACFTAPIGSFIDSLHPQAIDAMISKRGAPAAIPDGHLIFTAPYNFKHTGNRRSAEEAEAESISYLRSIQSVVKQGEKLYNLNIEVVPEFESWKLASN